MSYRNRYGSLAMGERTGGEGDCIAMRETCAKCLTSTLSPRERAPAEPVILGWLSNKFVFVTSTFSVILLISLISRTASDA